MCHKSCLRLGIKRRHFLPEKIRLWLNGNLARHFSIFIQSEQKIIWRKEILHRVMMRFLVVSTILAAVLLASVEQSAAQGNFSNTLLTFWFFRWILIYFFEIIRQESGLLLRNMGSLQTWRWQIWRRRCSYRLVHTHYLRVHRFAKQPNRFVRSLERHHWWRR